MTESPQWAVTLLLNPQERLEDRLGTIIRYVLNVFLDHLDKQWLISDLDATGKLGHYWTQKLNQIPALNLASPEFLALLDEDGQILELEATLIHPNDHHQALFTIFVRDGDTVDVVSFVSRESMSSIPHQILGDYREIDPQLFVTANEAPINYSRNSGNLLNVLA